MHESLAPGLAKAADVFRARGAKLVFWDCYRPHAVQVEMFDAVPDPNWVARPGTSARSHESGRSVDVTLADGALRVAASTWAPASTTSRQAQRLSRPTGSPPSSRPTGSGCATGWPPAVLPVYSGEWWHFDGPGADVGQPILDVPLN